MLRATAAAPHFPGTRDLQVDAGIESPSFAPFHELLGLQGDVDAPFDLDVAIEMKPDALEIPAEAAAGTLLIPDRPLPLAWMPRWRQAS